MTEPVPPGPTDDSLAKAKEAKDKLDFEHLKLSHDYAWNWHQYHAGQRMNLFRFFLIVIAILAAGYIKALDLKSDGLGLGIAVATVVLAYLFWRADIRSVDLITIGEGHLKATEEKLASYLGLLSIRLATQADTKTTETALRYPSRHLYSLKQIIWAIYLLIGFCGLATAIGIAYPYISSAVRCFRGLPLT